MNLNCCPECGKPMKVDDPEKYDHVIKQECIECDYHIDKDCRDLDKACQSLDMNKLFEIMEPGKSYIMKDGNLVEQ